jgi:hypothetical protein
VEAKLNKDSPGSICIRAGGAGENGDQYAPGAYLDGKTLVLPTVTVKDAEGKTLTTGQLTLGVDKTCRFDYRFPSGYKGKYDVDIQPVMGPFEYKVSKSIEPLP